MSKRADTEDGQSYQRHTIQIVREMSTRAGNIFNKDEDFVNVVFEIVKDKRASDSRDFVLKRSGSALQIPSVASSEVRGVIFWEDQGKYLYCVGTNIYVYTVATNTTATLSGVFATTSGDVGFTEYLYDTNNVVIVATDGTKLVTIDSSNTVTPCVDADMPQHLPYPVFIDGYILVVKVNTADIYNSDLNNPLSWTPGNFISAEMSPDLLKRLCKVNNYVVALGTESAEYFYDAGNATGSPLSRNDSPIKINTYLGGVSQFGNDVFYIGKTMGGHPGVFQLKDFKIEELSTPSIVRYLTLVTESNTTWRTNVIPMQGHTLLLVSAGQRSFVFDLEEKLWGRFAYQGTELMDLKYVTKVTTDTINLAYFCFKNSDSAIYKFDDTLATDNGVNFTFQTITEQSNFGSLNRKTMSKFALYADRTPNDSNLQVYWTDDDFQHWQGPKSINMNQDLQSTYVMGSFRQRAFKLQYTGPYILRLQYIEVDINMGVS